MKYGLGLLFFLTANTTVVGQSKETIDDVVLTSLNRKTGVTVNDRGILTINVSPDDVQKFKAAGLVTYRDLGAKGDGKTDDIDAIAATHAFANQYGLSVKVNDGATYYISGKERTAVIMTDTDFGSATFMIDDTETQHAKAPVFVVRSTLKIFTPEGLTTLKRNQEKVNLTLPATCIVSVTNDHVKQYIRFGLNQNNGASQTDIFVVDKEGNIDMSAPVVWDFDQITHVTALPIDSKQLKIKGGIFITIANQAESKYNYYSRNLAIRRSNVLVDGLEHRITGEGDHGAPYGGFISIAECAYVTVKNTILTGHKTYYTIGSAGKQVSMGTYDITVNRAVNVSFVNCRQTNDINDRTYWGIMGSNYCKNLLYDSCVLSRFDAHMGVANATIRNSTLGHMGINAIGSGTLLIENSTILGRSLVNLRSDYGSTWQGEFVIRNCIFIPGNGTATNFSLINGRYSGLHNFGYTCYMPEKITIENLQIRDPVSQDDYRGATLFADFNPEMIDDSYLEKYPYVKTKEVVLRNVTTSSGKPVRVCDNPYIFRNVNIIYE